MKCHTCCNWCTVASDNALCVLVGWGPWFSVFVLSDCPCLLCGTVGTGSYLLNGALSGLILKSDEIYLLVTERQKGKQLIIYKSTQ